MMKIWVDGKMVDARRPAVSAWDHGLLYGDGAYETVRIYAGRPFLLDEHLRRLTASAKAIGLTRGWSAARITGAVAKVIKANRLSGARVRITLTRGVGKFGLDPALCPKPTCIVAAEPILDAPGAYDGVVRSTNGAVGNRSALVDPRIISKIHPGVRLIIADTRRNHPASVNPRIKSLSFLNNVLAKREAAAAGAYDAVMLNLDGEITESTTSNLFIVRRRGSVPDSAGTRGGASLRGVELVTPSLSCGILAGVTRDLVINIARRLKISVVETRICPSDLRNADEAFLTSTTIEVLPVSVIGKYRIKKCPGPVTRCLHNIYRRVVGKWLVSGGSGNLRKR